MDWTIHPDGGMWMGDAKFIHACFATISRDMVEGWWHGRIVTATGASYFHSMSFTEVITEMEATIILLEAS